MKDKAISPTLLAQVEKLQQKYDSMGQDISAYLDGLQYANYLTYWEYIHLDTLLSLQNPKTSFPDESVFIMYHQITELYFKLILHEFRQISADPENEPLFVRGLRRCNRYFLLLVNSFEVMVEGMEKAQFMRFRMSLLPSSGFQSVQYRMIELYAAPLAHLVGGENKETAAALSLQEQMKNIYWKKGAVELSTGKKTLTLKMFEEKYEEKLCKLATDLSGNTLWHIYKNHQKTTSEGEELKQLMRTFDRLVNVNWSLVHFKSAARYLHKDAKSIAATGGTNWQKYLPPRFQKSIFFPELWTEKEKNNWGKGYIMGILKSDSPES